MSHHLHQASSGFLSGHLIVMILLIGAACCVVLIIPVLNDKFLGSIGTPLTKAAPITFFAGLGILIIGLLSGIAVLDLAGAALMIVVLIGALLVHY
jgi:hypothetical protein